MPVMKRSLAVRRRRKKSGDDESLQHNACQSASTKAESSIDTFVIHGRTRYPSSKETEPDPTDMDIAQRLLSYDKARESKHLKATPSEVNNVHASRHVSPTTTGTSSVYSTVQSALSSDAFAVRDTQQFQDRYNIMARVYGLPLLESIQEVDPSHTGMSTGGRPSLAKILWHKIIRKQPSKHLQRTSSHNLLRKASVTSLLGSKSLQEIQYSSLEEAFQACGASIVHLPGPYFCSSLTLVAPTCIAATANHLAVHGPHAHGLFRVPGKPSAVNSLYQHYMISLQKFEPATANVQSNVGSSRLPPDLRCSTHDVAAVFGKVLRAIPGGILGSQALYNALSDISNCSKIKTNVHVEKHSLISRLIALALGNMRSSRRLSLICVVFGLLSYIVRDFQAPLPAGPTGKESCRKVILANGSEGAKSLQKEYDGTGSTEDTVFDDIVLVFAPLLISGSANETNKSSTRLLHDPVTGEITTKKYHMKQSGNGNFTTPVDVYKDSARIVRMLLQHWTEVVAHLQVLEKQRTVGSIPHRRSNLTQRNLLAMGRKVSSSFDENGECPMMTACNQWLDGTQAGTAPSGNQDRPKSIGMEERGSHQTTEVTPSDRQTGAVDTEADCCASLANPSKQACSKRGPDPCCLQSNSVELLTAVDSDQDVRNSHQGACAEEATSGRVNDNFSNQVEDPEQPGNTDHRMSSSGTTIIREKSEYNHASQVPNDIKNSAATVDIEAESRESLHKLIEAFGEGLDSSTYEESASTQHDSAIETTDKVKKQNETKSVAKDHTPTLITCETQAADGTFMEPTPGGERATPFRSFDEPPIEKLANVECHSAPCSSKKDKKSLLPRPTSGLRLETDVASAGDISPTKESPSKMREKHASRKGLRLTSPPNQKELFYQVKHGKMATMKLHAKIPQMKKDVNLFPMKSAGDMRGSSQAIMNDSRAVTPTVPSVSPISKSKPACKGDNGSGTPHRSGKNVTDSVAKSGTNKPKVGMLYQEIRTVSEQLREKEKEYQFWKSRAERAENALQSQEGKREASKGSSSVEATHDLRSM